MIPDVDAEPNELGQRFTSYPKDSYSFRRGEGCTWTRKAPTLEEIDRGETDE
jgi:hypothetical protein